MKTKKKMQKKFLIYLLSVLIIFGSGQSTFGALNPANFTEDLNQLVLDGNILLVTLENTTLASLTMASQMSSLENAVQTYLNSVGDLYKTVSASTDNTTMSLTNEMLIPLQTLSTVSVSLAQSLAMLSREMVLLSAVTPVIIMEASLTSMLRLSDDIGVMADRILEMADKILIMADNIGIMADRILATQIIQSDNIKIVVDAALETQKNLLLLFGMLL